MKANNKIAKEIFLMALQNHKANNFKAAENLYNNFLKERPNHFQAIFNLGALYAQNAKLQLAKESFSKAVQIKPDSVDANVNLGAVLTELGDYKGAIVFSEKAIQINPNNSVAYNNLGAALKDTGDYQKALSFFQKAIQINPNFVNAHTNIALVFKELRKIDDEILCYEKLNKMQPNSAYVHQNLGRAYLEKGSIKESINYFKSAIKYDSNNFLYYYLLSDLEKGTLNSKLKEKISECIKYKKPTKKNLSYANLLLSKYELREQNYKKEFNYLLEGHANYFESRTDKFRKDIEYWLDILPKAIKVINFGDLKKSSEDQNSNMKPIFIVGVPRCGSTLVEKLITSSDQKIVSGEEVNILSMVFRDKLNKKEPIDTSINNFKTELLKRYKSKELIKEKDNFCFTDKSLDNFFYIGLIKLIFPNAKIINCKRNSISSIMSILKNNLPGISWAHDLNHIFKYFDVYYNMIKFHKQNIPNFIYDIELEKLIGSPEEESKKLLAFCDIPWNKKCLNFYKRKDLISRTTSNYQIRKAINSDSLKIYLPYKKFLKKYSEKYSWFN